MGLFGLGWPEIAVVGILGLLLFGPERLAPFAKDLGKSASGLKEVTDSFAEGMKARAACTTRARAASPRTFARLPAA